MTVRHFIAQSLPSSQYELNNVERDVKYQIFICEHYLVTILGIEVYMFKFQVNTLNEQDWEKLQQANVLANVQHAFDTSDTEGSGDNESLIGAFDMLSPSGHTDAQTLALMLQEQLDAINNEIRYVYHLSAKQNL